MLTLCVLLVLSRLGCCSWLQAACDGLTVVVCSEEAACVVTALLLLTTRVTCNTSVYAQPNTGVTSLTGMVWMSLKHGMTTSQSPPP
jgi:hypothetical protein